MRRIALGLVTVVSLGLLTAAPAGAQIRFSIGSGGVSVGNTPPGYYPYGSGYGSGYSSRYGARPHSGTTIVIDRSYRAPATQYIVPTPAPYTGPGVTIRNPPTSEAALSYTINSRQAHEIAAGETQQLAEAGRYLVEFDRGGDFGHARYTITEGLYEFALTDHGWELYRQPDHAAEAERVKSNPLP